MAQRKSNSYESILERCTRAAEGAAEYAEQMPKETTKYSVPLRRQIAEMVKLNTAQEALKVKLANATAALNAKMKEALGNRGKVVRLAEVAFGREGNEMKAFRPDEGRVTKRKTPAAAKKAT